MHQLPGIRLTARTSMPPDTCVTGTVLCAAPSSRPCATGAVAGGAQHSSEASTLMLARVPPCESKHSGCATTDAVVICVVVVFVL